MSFKDKIISELEAHIEKDSPRMLKNEREWPTEKREAIDELIEEARQAINNLDPNRPIGDAVMTSMACLATAGAIISGIMPSEFYAGCAVQARKAEAVGMLSQFFGDDLG